MIALIQRVTEASVSVAGERIGAIGPGLLALVGVRPDDDEQTAQRLLERLLAYRAVKGFKKGMDEGDAEESLKQIKQEAADADFPESSAKTAANKPTDRNG
ncbi:MAG: hypothetical protein EBX78_04425 [Gammaproteobacteria bacterium]|nr:hypothetical protein [Gammaproteobacteria bacterium]